MQEEKNKQREELHKEPNKELRVSAVRFETREEDDGAMIIEGSPIVYGEASDIGGGLYERIAPHAVREAVADPNQMLLWGHDDLHILASKRNNTLTTIENEKGVTIRADLSKTRWGRDAYEAVRNGAIGGMSFGFLPGVTEWEDEGGRAVRVLRTISKIFEYSIVAFPAYTETEVYARARQEYARICAQRRIDTKLAHAKLTLQDLQRSNYASKNTRSN